MSTTDFLRRAFETGLADSFYDEDSKCPNCARKVKDDWQTKRLESLMQSWRKGDFLQYTKFEEVPEKGGKKKNRRLGPFFRRTKEYVKTPLLLNGKIPIHTFCHYCDAWLEAYAKILNGRFVGIIEVEADGEEKEFIRMPPETTAKALREEFERRLSHLRESCKHEKSRWMDIEWAPAHFSGRALVCLGCEEMLKRKPRLWASTVRNESRKLR